VAHRAGPYPGFCGMKRLGVFLLPLDGMLVHRRATPSIKFAGTHLHTWVERGTVRVKCLVQEHNTMSPARARARTARFGDQRASSQLGLELRQEICFEEFEKKLMQYDHY